jgi:hypothetical protein
MRKIANILFTIVFLTSFIGIQISKHYSNGKLFDVAVYNNAESCCNISHVCNTDSMGASHCEHQQNHNLSCKTTTKIFKLHDNFISEKHPSLEVSFINLFLISFFQSTKSNLYLSHLFNTTPFIVPHIPAYNPQAKLGVFIC